jgi:Protein of unknown function DUF262
MSFKEHLFPGESFVLQDKSGTPQISLSNEDINEKYKKGEIRIVTEQARYPLDSIETMLDSDKYDLNPEYQRRKRWDSVRKSRLIESFIMNVPIPPIFLYEVEYSNYEVMDGLQRLTAIYDFYKGKFVLEGLEYWKELNGRKYKELPEQVRRGVDRRYLSSIILLQETAKTNEEADFLKQVVFERLNSGGEKLTPQETRNALHNGKFNQLYIQLAENDLFRKMWQMPLQSEGEEKLLESDPIRKMEDFELVLRFFAYRHIEEMKGLTVEKFLDEYLKQANKFPDETIKQLENIFNATIVITNQVFGKSAFLLPSVKKTIYKSPTKTIYDPMMQAFANNIAHKENLLKNAESIKGKIYKNPESLNPFQEKYLFDGRYNGRNAVLERIYYYHNFLKDFTS